MKRALCTDALFLLAALAAADIASAQSFPSRPIKFVVPWPAGGPPDAVARLIGQRIGEALKQQVVIDNRPGANSVIGTEFVARSAPDGYTYLVTTGSHTTNALHLAGELFKAATGTSITHVPYKGAAPALIDLLGGHIDMMFASPLSMAPPIQQGRLRGIAQMGQKRSHVLPELSTLDELGIHGARIGGWYGLYAPAKSPKENTDRVLAEVLKALKEPDIRQKIDNLGAEPVGLASDEFMRFIIADIDKYKKLAQRINLKID